MSADRFEALVAQRAITVFPHGLDNGWSRHDLPFIASLITTLTARSDIDSTRVGLFGFDSGGVIALLVACRYPQMVTAVAVHSAAFYGCDAALGGTLKEQSLSIMVVSGTAGGTPFEPPRPTSGWAFELRRAMGHTAALGETTDCLQPPMCVTRCEWGPPSNPEVFNRGPRTVSVTLSTWGHRWIRVPGILDASAEIVEFLLHAALPASPPPEAQPAPPPNTPRSLHSPSSQSPPGWRPPPVVSPTPPSMSSNSPASPPHHQQPSDAVSVAAVVNSRAASQEPLIGPALAVMIVLVILTTLALFTALGWRMRRSPDSIREHPRRRLSHLLSRGSRVRVRSTAFRSRLEDSSCEAAAIHSISSARGNHAHAAGRRGNGVLTYVSSTASRMGRRLPGQRHGARHVARYGACSHACAAQVIGAMDVDHASIDRDASSRGGVEFTAKQPLA